MRITTAALAAIALAASAATSAQMQPVGTLTTSASISGVGETNTDLDRGGDVHWSGAIANGTLVKQWTPEFSAGLSVGYTYEDWQFSDSTGAFGDNAPWNNLQRPSIGVPLTYLPAPDVLLTATPQLAWSYESGARVSDAKYYGATLGAAKIFSPSLMLGLGVAVFREIGKTVAIPYPIINWRIDDHWRVTNPFPEGPTGGGGVELAYAFNPQWELAGGAAYRSVRFRLDENGPVPDGIGEYRTIPVFARLSWRFDTATRLDFYAGAATGGKVWLRDAHDSDISDDKMKTAPLLGLTLATRF
jgi:Domain of unknown function (DUF6268)